MEFDLITYYDEVHSGNVVDNTKLLNYIRSFKRVYLWGASYLGTAIGKYLLKNNIQFSNYWDMRSSELKNVNGIDVIMPFYTDVSKDETLIIYCIGNNVIRHVVLKELKSKGFNNIIRGDYLYEGAICPFSKSTGIDAKICQGTMCCRSIFCNRLSNIIKSKNMVDNPLHMFSVTVVINQKCSLRCKCCTSYMNEYTPKDRINIPTERVLDDIDRFFGAMDSLGTVTVMGGEPFLHPDISKIVQHLLTKDNFGLVSIATSGTFPIKPEMLEGLNDPRVNISFSNYEQSLPKGLVQNMYNSIETVKNAGVSYTVGVTMPEWAIPSTLYDLGDSIETMIRKKSLCNFPNRCMQIKNGWLHPCDFGTATFSLGICKKPNSALSLTDYDKKSDLKNAIFNFINQPYYPCCGHCAGWSGSTQKAAEQGYMDFKKPLTLSN